MLHSPASDYWWETRSGGLSTLTNVFSPPLLPPQWAPRPVTRSDLSVAVRPAPSALPGLRSVLTNTDAIRMYETNERTSIPTSLSKGFPTLQTHPTHSRSPYPGSPY